MFDIGMQELIVIFIVALLVFGPKRLPELGKTIGRGIAELKRSMEGVKEQIQSEIDSTEIHKLNLDIINKEEKTEMVSLEPKGATYNYPAEKEVKEIKEETNTNG